MQTTTFEYYKARSGKWYWRCRHSNGKITADCGFGYSRKDSCQRAIKRHIKAMSGGDIKIKELR